jgi:hypothetical protein
MLSHSGSSDYVDLAATAKLGSRLGGALSSLRTLITEVLRNAASVWYTTAFCTRARAPGPRSRNGISESWTVTRSSTASMYSFMLDAAMLLINPPR